MRAVSVAHNDRRRAVTRRQKEDPSCLPQPYTPPSAGPDFRGKTKSFTVLPGGGGWPTCRHCGSTIYPQRFESTNVRSIAGSRMAVDRYVCRCGKGHEVHRPLEAAAA